MWIRKDGQYKDYKEKESLIWPDLTSKLVILCISFADSCKIKAKFLKFWYI